MPNVMHVLLVFMSFLHVKVSNTYQSLQEMSNHKKEFIITYKTLQFLAKCNCTEEGSHDITCDDHGVCNCKVNFINDKCDECAPGFYNFPTCEGKHKCITYVTGSFYLLTHCFFFFIFSL